MVGAKLRDDHEPRKDCAISVWGGYHTDVQVTMPSTENEGSRERLKSPKDPNRINNTMCPKTTKNKKIAISYIIEL